MDETVLPPDVADVATVLGSWSAMQAFYLSGGTALALQLGHRRSRDLDFFTRQPCGVLPPLPDVDLFLARFDRAEWILRASDQLHWRLNGVSVTLLAYPFAPRFPFRSWRGLAVADARDVAAQKAYTIGRRAVARDYVDMRVVLRAGIASLETIIQLAQDTYGAAFSPRLFLQQLTYTRDLPDQENAVQLLTVPEPFAAIERDLQAAVRQWASRHSAGPRQDPRA